jgi:hypothetical protein
MSLAVALAGCTASTATENSWFPTRSPSSSVPSTLVISSPVVVTSTPVGTGCGIDADYCDTFSDPNSGWPRANPSHFYADYDPYLGGSYRMGERTDAAISEDAPYDITDAANDYSVRVDVDATPGDGFGGNNQLGITCWEHEIEEGGDGTTSAFLLQLSGTAAMIGLWDGADGSYQLLKSVPARTVLDTSATNHLTAQCIQGTASGSTHAQLSLAVNGAEVISISYAKSIANYDWSVGARVGLLAVGEGSDVFYDNFAITGACAGDFC